MGTLEAFAIYSVAFLARPVGAFIFGHYGDRIGRKAALIATLLLMGVATLLVAFVPGYDRIGIWGAVSLTVLRFVQGIISGSAASGVVQFSPSSGPAGIKTAGSWERGRSSVCRPGFSWRTWP